MDRIREAKRLFYLGKEQCDKSRFPEAIASWQQALTIFRKIGNRQGEANSLGSLGNAYNSLGQYQQALDYHQQSLTIAREIGYRQGEANSLGNLGVAYYSLGQFQKAINYHQQSLEISREIGYRQGEAISLGKLGNAYYSLGQFPKAIDYHQQSLEIKREIGYRKGEAASLGNLGSAYDSLGQYQRAIDYHQQSVEIAREIGYRKGEAICLGNLGSAYNSLGQYQRAIEYLQQSVEIAREIGYRKGEAICLGSLGRAYNSLGQYQKAIDYHQQYLEISREIGNRQGEAFSLNNLSETLKKLNRFAEAEKNLWEAITIWEEIRGGLVDDSHKISIFETQKQAYQNLQEVLVAQDKFTTALEISERGRTRAFVELLRQRLTTPANLDKAEEKTTYITISDIQKVAKTQNATLIEYSIVFGEIYIWVIQPTGEITFRQANLKPLETLGKSLNNLEEIILKARVSLGIVEKDNNNQTITLESEFIKDKQDNFPLLQLLYKILIEPIADLLPSHPEAPIIFIPHYALFLVPFAALQNPQGRYFIEDHTPLISPSIQVLQITHEKRVRNLQKKALVVAEPTLHESFQKDPYKLKPYPSMIEAGESIASILDTQSITGNNATKVAVINQMLGTRILHIFAHGLLDEYQNEENAKLGIPGTIVLAPDGEEDGALNAAEILNLELNSEIVVLAACSTGKGKITGDGIVGLSRCFILAGVPSLIVSLWNIGAPAAKFLMTKFYQNLSQGENRAASLRHAMLETKKRFSSPKAWAGFTLIGESDPLELTIQKIQEALRTMANLDNCTPEEIVDAFSRLFDTCDNQFLSQITGLDIQTDSIEELAERIKKWCKTRPNVEENIENEIYEAGAADADEEKPEILEEILRRCQEKYRANENRQTSQNLSSDNKG
ncbi:CHAT domain-containing protein [Ancylothrix sp. C2]|uniref:CHAT domain-containing protein n=1 Tax=Ancylothrix sp. D3o TaxID=2953691 RepID=UPI0021BAC1AE|nr:CHAT domain-containing tetratricopeptide repeat protein [Ancylothrix sp. D3o]MCT7950221.1 CHAT domain-containing protein [Ancylothrix sp. D3o]